MSDTHSPPSRASLAELLLLASVFVIAACGLVYELAAGALASYLLGDSVLQFSTVIGVYLFAMGLGSWLSRFVERQLVGVFLQVELLVGVIGGLMPAALFAVHSLLPPGEGAPFRVLLYGLGFWDAWPEDVWIKKAMATLFPKGKPRAAAGYGGIAQQYIFEYARIRLPKGRTPAQKRQKARAKSLSEKAKQGC